MGISPSRGGYTTAHETGSQLNLSNTAHTPLIGRFFYGRFLIDSFKSRGAGAVVRRDLGFGDVCWVEEPAELTDDVPEFHQGRVEALHFWVALDEGFDGENEYPDTNHAFNPAVSNGIELIPNRCEVGAGDPLSTFSTLRMPFEHVWDRGVVRIDQVLIRVPIKKPLS
jgi:hypothetical protein